MVIFLLVDGFQHLFLKLQWSKIIKNIRDSLQDIEGLESGLSMYGSRESEEVLVCEGTQSCQFHGHHPSIENDALLSSINYQASGSQTYQASASQVDKYDYSSNVVARLVDFENRGRETIGLGYTKVKPPFNHNYSIMPKINKSVDDLLLKSDRKFELTTGSNKPVSLTTDPVLTNLDGSDNPEVCVEILCVTVRSKEKEEKSACRSTHCSISSSKSHFVPKVDFVGKFEIIKIKPNEMFKNFKANFVKTGDDIKNKYVLESNSSPLTEKVNQAYSTITTEAYSNLNPNYEPYVPTGSLEQACTSSSPGQSDCDVKTFDPNEFHD
ncbi:hypothetical protein R6Q57_008561 [Mikania cordata]